MKKRYFFILTILIGIQIPLFAQDDGGVSIGKGNNDADKSAILELVSDSKGLLIPRLTSSERKAISSPAVGLLVFDTDKNNFYYYADSEWQAFAGVQTSYGTEVPTSGIKEGDLFFNTSENLLYIYISNKWQEITGGDMQKSTYDKDENGVVDNAQTVNNLTVATAVPAEAVFTDNQQLSISGKRLSLSSNGGTSSYVDLPTGSGTGTVKGTTNQIITSTDDASITTLALADTITGLKSVTATNFIGNATTATTAVTASTANTAAIATNAINLSNGAAGAIPYQTATGQTTMLEKGQNGQVLTLNSGLPAWSDASGMIKTVEGTNQQITTHTDTNTGVVTLSLSDTISGLTSVKATNFLGNATTATTATIATSSVNLAYGTAGAIPYQTTAGQTAMLAKGTEGQILTLNAGVPAWSDNIDTIRSIKGTKQQINTVTDTTSGTITLSLPDTIKGLKAIKANIFLGNAETATTATLATNALTANTAVFLTGGSSGSIPYQAGSGQTTMLEKGTDGQVLTLASGLPTWADATGGTGSSGVSSVTGTTNQITATPTTGAVQLSLPSTITGLTSVTATSFNGTATKATTATTATNLASGSAGSIPYQSASGTTQMLTKGTDGQVLTLSSGIPGWEDATGGISSIKGTSNQITATTSSGTVTLSLPSTITGLTSVTATSFKGTATTATNLASGTAGSLPYQTAAGQTTMLSKGSDGQVLTLASGVPTWANASSVSGVSAANGLTESSATIKLGGTLTAATTIDQDDKDMTFTTGTGKLIADGTFKATGAVYAHVTEVTDASYTITDSDFMLILTIAGGSSINLPNPSSYPGRILCVRNNSAVQGSSGTIQYSTYVPVNNSTVLASRAQMLISDGSNWYVLAGL